MQEFLVWTLLNRLTTGYSPTWEIPATNGKQMANTRKWKAWLILGYLVPFIKEHYADENKRNNQLQTRLTGDQAISLAGYGYHWIDGLECADESPAQHLRTLALAWIALHLRQAGHSV